MKPAKILIIGRMPPPVGGITTHVSRLVENLYEKGFESFDFADLNESFLSILLKLVKHRAIHLHISSPYWQVCIALMCKVFAKKLVITYHGNWGRYDRAGNLAVILSCRLAHIPIAQNEESFKEAFRWNKNARLISTYLNSRYIAPLDTTHMMRLSNFRKRYSIIVCTNAWNVAFDKYHREIYGISALIEWIASHKDYGLTISDPSGNYARYIQQAHFPLPANVLFLSTPHDFRNVLEVADAFIRNTTTDAISLSICEALELKVPVLASASVSRPGNCRVFSELGKINLEAEIAAGKELLRKKQKSQCTQASIEELLTVYRVVLDKNIRK